MNIIVTDNAVFGPYQSIEINGDHLLCDNSRLPLSVIGAYDISDDLSLLPGPSPEEIADKRLSIQNKNKAACKAFILSKYPEPIQRSAALGVYPQEAVDAMTDHIARCVAEENRVFDLLESSDDPESVIDPVWPEE